MLIVGPMSVCLYACLSVCLSVYLSNAGNVSKRMDIVNLSDILVWASF